MRKFLKFAFVGAIALTGFGLVSCSSDDDLDNDTTVLSGEAVKTQFTISFPQNVVKTKQTAQTVQNAENIATFRGMDNIVLVPFAAEGAAGTDPIAKTATPLGKNIVLTNMIKPKEQTVSNSIPATTPTDNGLVATSNSVLFNDVDIPLGTGSFLFYGKAIDQGTEKFVDGALTATITESAAPSNYGFAPVVINSSTTINTIGSNLASYVTSIANATGWSTTENTALQKLYLNFTSMKTGSSRDIQAAVLDLYQSLYKNTDAVSTAICAAITATGKATAPATPDGSLTFDPSLGEVKSDISTETTTYPLNVNIPDGAALLKWELSGTPFSGSTPYTAVTATATQKIDGNLNTTTNVYTANIGDNVTGKFADYVYPASLYYLANSGVKTANTSKKDTYNGTNDWDAILGDYTNGTAVAVETRSVAIVDPIQYAVGRLDTKVTAAATTLYDRKGDAVNGIDDTRFPITGVLIGGQKAVDYKFEQSGSTEYTIYDNIVKANPGNTPKATTGGSAYNYTLALETAKDQAIYVAVEFLNNSGQDFQGVDGVVPAGGKFYLVAQLDPSADVTGKVDGSASTGNKVFKQDYKTIVNFTITQGTSNTDSGWTEGTSQNTGGLGAAYNTIPDLRTPKLELGLSVNLHWESGITFTVNI